MNRREQVAADDELVKVTVWVRKGTLEQIDAIALRANTSRHAVFREALSWQVVREYRLAFRRERLRQKAAFNAWLHQMRTIERELEGLNARATAVMAVRGQNELPAGASKPRPAEGLLLLSAAAEDQERRDQRDT